MRLRFIIGSVALFLLASVVLSTALFFPEVLLMRTSSDYSSITANSSNIIMRENAQPGTYKWEILPRNQATTEIQAYAGATSVQPGQKLTFYVSTQLYGTRYSLAIFRLGWYGGEGGRQLYFQDGLLGRYQGYYNPAEHKLIDCYTCHIDNNTHLIEANWKPSAALTIPSSWVSGVYLAKFTDIHGKETYAPFDVLGNFSSTYVAVTSDTTYAAYNGWGGMSLYGIENGFSGSEDANAPRAVKVSFDRPYLEGQGSGQVLLYEINAIRWLEKQGYDISYMSSADLHEHPEQLLHHRAYLSLGHDEYWTREMRDGVENARDHGVGLAFLGADVSGWQMRFEPDSMGQADRTVVCYKVATADNDLTNDPFYGQDNSRVTAEWRDPVLARPENGLIGIMYSNLTTNVQPRGFSWVLGSGTNFPLLDGTGLMPDQGYGCDLVGYEWDRVFDNNATPPGLVILSRSPTISEEGQVDYSNTTYYIAPSGAMVFAAGSIYWTTALDDYRFSIDRACLDKDLVVPGIQKLMANVMDALVVLHPSNQLASLPTAHSSYV